MKKILLLCCVFTLLTLFSCFGGDVEVFEDIVAGITCKTGLEIERQNSDLELFGIGGSMPGGKIIRYETLAFRTKKLIKKDEYIQLISGIVDLYVKNIYSDPRMKEYLEEHPFTYNNLRIEVFVCDEKGRDVESPEIGVISLVSGDLGYKTFMPSKNGYSQLESDITEPYEQALRRIGK